MNDYLRAELEQLRMVFQRLRDNVDRFDLELARFETACGVRRQTAEHPGESWQTEDIPPFHWHGDEKCNCKISFTDPADVKRDEWEGIP